MEHKSRRLAAEILQSIESELRGDKATPSDTEFVQNKKGKAWESYMATIEDAIKDEYEPLGK
jgi:hypothetical protein